MYIQIYISHGMGSKFLLVKNMFTGMFYIWWLVYIKCLHLERIYTAVRVKAMVFPVVMNGCESWTVKKAECQRIDAFELWCWRRLLRGPIHVNSWLIGKDSDAGRDWGQEENGTTEDEMARWHHWLDGRESEWTLGVGDGQGGVACCDSRGRKELDMTEQLNWTELINNFLNVS